MNYNRLGIGNMGSSGMGLGSSGMYPGMRLGSSGMGSSGMRNAQMETVDPYTISIDLITKGDFTTKPYDPIPFEPNMLIDSTAPNQPKSVRQIYFAPMVELQKSDFAELEANTSYNSSSFMVDVLTNPTKFAALLRIARSNRDTLTYDKFRTFKGKFFPA